MLFINELFASIQGEGAFTGTPSIFVRFQGCKCRCSFCDTKHTWKLGEPNGKPLQYALEKRDCAHYATTTAEELAKTIKEKFPNVRHVVLTGGEPCLYDLRPLTNLLVSQGNSVQLETSGTEPCLSRFDVWVTVSPKIDQDGKQKLNEDTIRRANEIKMAVASQKDIDDLEKCLALRQKKPLIFLQPISQDEKATQLCIKTAMQNNWRVSFQVHKYLNVR